MSMLNQKTIADICDELRSGEYAPLANRIEAAVKREYGNMAAMRGALLECVDMLSSFKDDPEVAESISIADAALLEPPRNCDVGTAEEQAKRFAELCTSHSKEGARGLCEEDCPLGKDYGSDCALAWAQMPYEADDPAIDQLRYKMEGEAAYGND